MAMYDSLPPEIHSLTDEEESSLQGNYPFKSLVEFLSAQFDEFKETGYVQLDNTNYFDEMADAISVSEQITRSDLEESDLDGGSLMRMKELFHEAVLSLMEQLGVDLYQVEDPFQLARLLYTDMMLVDQRQLFYNDVINNEVEHCSLESEEKIAYAKMKDGDPADLWKFTERWMDQPVHHIVPFLRRCGLDDLLPWVEVGSLPEGILYDVFLGPRKANNMMFLGYIQSQEGA